MHASQMNSPPAATKMTATKTWPNAKWALTPVLKWTASQGIYTASLLLSVVIYISLALQLVLPTPALLAVTETTAIQTSNRAK